MVKLQLHSQTIGWQLVQTRFAAEAMELPTEMILAANAGPHVLNVDRELDVDPWVTVNRIVVSYCAL